MTPAIIPMMHGQLSCGKGSSKKIQIGSVDLLNRFVMQ